MFGNEFHQVMPTLSFATFAGKHKFSGLTCLGICEKHLRQLCAAVFKCWNLCVYKV